MRYKRRGPLVFKDGRLYRTCLTITGAKILIWRLRRKDGAQ